VAVGDTGEHVCGTQNSGGTFDERGAGRACQTLSRGGLGKPVTQAVVGRSSGDDARLAHQGVMEPYAISAFLLAGAGQCLLDLSFGCPDLVGEISMARAITAIDLKKSPVVDRVCGGEHAQGLTGNRCGQRLWQGIEGEVTHGGHGRGPWVFHTTEHALPVYACWWKAQPMGAKRFQLPSACALNGAGVWNSRWTSTMYTHNPVGMSYSEHGCQS